MEVWCQENLKLQVFWIPTEKSATMLFKNQQENLQQPTWRHATATTPKVQEGEGRGRTTASLAMEADKVCLVLPSYTVKFIKDI